MSNLDILRNIFALSSGQTETGLLKMNPSLENLLQRSTICHLIKSLMVI